MSSIINNPVRPAAQRFNGDRRIMLRLIADGKTYQHPATKSHRAWIYTRGLCVQNESPAGWLLEHGFAALGELNDKGVVPLVVTPAGQAILEGEQP